jgi:hypothetical protein
MPEPPNIPPGPPLVSYPDGLPLLYDVLGVDLYLDPLGPDDVDRLDRAMALVDEWIGPKLQWTGGSALQAVRAFEPSDLELISCHPHQLKNDRQPPSGRVQASAIATFEVACHGGKDRPSPSPYALRFACLIVDPDARPVFGNRAVLRVAVPTTWPLRDFYDRVCALAQTLRVRWGAAGFMYSGWEYYAHNTTWQAIFAHARRHMGFDVGYYNNQLVEWHDAIRSVNWLTILGPAFVERLDKAGRRPETNPLVAVEPLGAGLLLRAGDVPQAGDINRLQIPAAYVTADAMVRPIRATTCHNFGVPWTEVTTNDWLTRFERGARS